MRRALVLVALFVVGCAPAGSPPLVCDPAREGQVDFVYHESEGHFAPYLPHGNSLLVVDGSCRYYIYSRRFTAGVILTGMLTPEELAVLNDELLTFPWSTVDGVEQNFRAGADAPTITLRRGDHVAQCYQSCAGHEALTSLRSAATAAREALDGPAVPMTGPVYVDVRVHSPMEAPVPPVVWTGTSLTAGGRILVDDEADAAALRALRETHESCCGPPMYLLEGETVLAAGVADVLPVDIELFSDHESRGPLPY